MEKSQRHFARPHILFLWIALVFGIANAAINPPFMGIDEENHFARIIGFAQGRLLESAEVSFPFADQVARETARMRSFFGHEGRVGGRDFFHDSNNKFSFRDTGNDLLAKAPAEDGSKEAIFYRYNRAVIYSPTAYLSALPFTWAVMKAGANPLVTLYIARFSIFLASTALMYYAIRITPIFKWQLFLLALLQTSVFTRSSVNADPHVFGYAFLFIAWILDTLYAQEKLSCHNALALAVLSALLCISKPAYALLPGMFFLLDGSQFVSMKQRILSVFGIVILPIALGLAWSWIAGEHYHTIPVGPNGYMERAPGVDEKAQLLFCLSHPLAFLHSIGVTFGRLWPLYMGQMLAMQGDSQVDMSLPFGLLGAAIVFFPALAFAPALSSGSTEICNITWRQRCLCFMLFIASALFICLMLYAGNTPLGSEEITGLQGRYFIPVLPLLFIAASQNFTKKITTGIHATITVYVISILAYSLYSLLGNDYIVR